MQLLCQFLSASRSQDCSRRSALFTKFGIHQISDLSRVLDLAFVGCFWRALDFQPPKKYAQENHPLNQGKSHELKLRLKIVRYPGIEVGHYVLVSKDFMLYFISTPLSFSNTFNVCHGFWNVFQREAGSENPDVGYWQYLLLYLPGDPKKCLRLPKHQTIGFCSITSMYLDSESIFINSDFGTSTSQIRQKLLEIHPLKDTLVFKRGGFWRFGGDQFWRKSNAGYIHSRNHIMNLWRKSRINLCKTKINTSVV